MDCVGFSLDSERPVLRKKCVEGWICTGKGCSDIVIESRASRGVARVVVLQFSRGICFYFRVRGFL